MTCRLEDRNNLTLKRFLRARDFNVPAASALFISHRHACWSLPNIDVDPPIGRSLGQVDCGMLRGSAM